MLLQGLSIELPPAAFGAENQIILTLSGKGLLELLLFDGFFLVSYYLLLLFLLDLSRRRIFYLLRLFPPRRLLLLVFLFGRLFGD